MEKKEKETGVSEKYFELEILRAAQGAISESIIKELTGYNGPLAKLTARVIEDNSMALYKLINESLTSLIGAAKFRMELKNALTAKLAKVLVARMGGELERQVDTLKSDPTTRAKITLAISSVIEDLSIKET